MVDILRDKHMAHINLFSVCHTMHIRSAHLHFHMIKPMVGICHQIALVIRLTGCDIGIHHRCRKCKALIFKHLRESRTAFRQDGICRHIDKLHSVRRESEHLRSVFKLQTLRHRLHHHVNPGIDTVHLPRTAYKNPRVFLKYFYRHLTPADSVGQLILARQHGVEHLRKQAVALVACHLFRQRAVSIQLKILHLAVIVVATRHDKLIRHRAIINHLRLRCRRHGKTDKPRKKPCQNQRGCHNKKYVTQFFHHQS